MIRLTVDKIYDEMANYKIEKRIQNNHTRKSTTASVNFIEPVIFEGKTLLL